MEGRARRGMPPAGADHRLPGGRAADERDLRRWRGSITYVERWEHLPGITIPEHVAFIIVACLAARHSMRMRPCRETGVLFAAVEAGDSAAIRREMEAGIDPNEPRTSDGTTALHVAARAGSAEAVTTLLDAGAVAAS